METLLPSRFNPAELARSRQKSQLALPVSHFKRFSALLANAEGEVVAQAQFELNEAKQATASGSLRTSVNVTCQRCMQVMEFQISEDFGFVFIDDEEQANQIEGDYDPVLVDDRNEIEAVDFLEDELILQLPLRLVHENEQECDQTVIKAVQAETGTAKTHHPFSGLDKLLKN